MQIATWGQLTGTGIEIQAAHVQLPLTPWEGRGLFLVGRDDIPGSQLGLLWYHPSRGESQLPIPSLQTWVALGPQVFCSWGRAFIV